MQYGSVQTPANAPMNIPTGATAVTQTLGDNTTKVATTAFVLANAAAGSGDVVGPAGATDGTIPLFDTATGKKIKGSAYTPTSFEAANSNIQSHIGNSTTAHGLTIANVTAAGNTFNGASQLVQLTAATKYPALDGSLITNLAGATSTFNITYAAHGLTVGALSPVVPIAKIGSTYAKAMADTAANIEVVGVAIEAVDASTLKIQQSGKYTATAHGFTGPAIWLSAATAGLLTETAPSTAGQFLKPIAKVIDANTLELVDYPATQISATGVYSTTFTSADSRITAGVLTVTHGLRQRPLFVTLMDGAASPVDVYPGVVYTTDDTFTVDLSSFTITGTWTLVASKGAGAAMPTNNGMWTLVSRVPITASLPATDGGIITSFSNLNGDLDKRYMLVVSAIQGAVAESGIEVYFNADNSGSHYWHQDFYGRDTSAAANVAGSPRNNIYVGYHMAALTHSFGLLEIDARSGSPRICDQRMTYGATGGLTRSVGAAIWNSTANITDMTIVADKANLVAAGSYIELWKLNSAPVSVPAGEWVLQERRTISGGAVTEVAFTGLTGNAAREYQLRAKIITAQANVECYVQFGTGAGPTYDTTAANYRRRFWTSAGAGTDQAFGGVPTGLIVTSGNSGKTTITIDALAGNGYRILMAEGVMAVGASAIGELAKSGGVWYNTVDEITAIKYISSVAGGLANGTVVELWRMGA